MGWATCPECLAEIADPRSRRYRYPFAVCRECLDLPFEKKLPSAVQFEYMQHTFPRCGTCTLETANPKRRYYDSPLCWCRDCGPAFWIEPTPTGTHDTNLVAAVVRLLRSNLIVAVKQLAGFQLVCQGVPPPEKVERVVNAARIQLGDETRPLVPHWPFEHLITKAVDAPLTTCDVYNPDGHPLMDNEDARHRLGDIADHLVLHDLELSPILPRP